MDFNSNVSPVEVINKGAFGGTYFRDIYSGVNNKFYKNSWKELGELENIDKKFYWTHSFSRKGPINSASSVRSSITLISQDLHARSF